MPEIPAAFSKLQLPPINKQNQVSFLEMFLLLVIAVLFYWFVVSPKKAELGVLNDKVETLKIEQAKIETQKTDLERLIRKMNTETDFITRLDEALPLNGKVFSLNLIIKKFADEAGITLDNAFFSSAGDAVIAGNRELIADPFAQKRKLKLITGSFSAKGNIGQITLFLKKMEESGRIFNIRDLQINPDPEGSIYISGGLEAYYFAP